MAFGQSCPKTCGTAHGVRNLNCTTPKRPQNLIPKIRTGSFCAVFFRTDAESAGEAGRQARRRRFSGVVRARSPSRKTEC
eukprot:15457785-Alexandrium_andersonii.AAC.1